MIPQVESPEIFPSVPGNSWICSLLEVKLQLRYLTGMQLRCWSKIVLISVSQSIPSLSKDFVMIILSRHHDPARNGRGQEL
jgi:hypothetical protein